MSGVRRLLRCISYNKGITEKDGMTGNKTFSNINITSTSHQCTASKADAILGAEVNKRENDDDGVVVFVNGAGIQERKNADTYKHVICL